MAKDSLSFQQLEDLFAELEGLGGSSRGIAVAAAFAGQARALEYGSVVAQRPWPRPGERTVLAVDPESGAQVVVSAQAPQGFLRVQAVRFAEQLTAALRQPVDWLDVAEAQGHITATTEAAARIALEEIRGAVPRDSGGLAASLHISE